MDWITRLNEAISYLERHLAQEVSYEDLARVACCSSYHFQRMFGYLAGMPLSEYIRRRRMSRAAADLQSGEKIIDVAARYGYESPTAFNRAFQSVHGMPPSQARQEGVMLRSYPPISFQITVKGVSQMEYRIEQKEAFRIVGVGAPLSAKMEENFQVVPALWGKACTDGTIEKLCTMMDGTPKGILGVNACPDGGAWRYYISVSSTLPKGDFEEVEIPASTWAVFPGAGAISSIQDLMVRIVQEWLPSSGYEYTNAPELEVYFNADPNDAKYEVWVPVAKA